MNIIVNNQTKEISNTNFAQALIELGFEDATVATAINGDFVPQTIRETTTLNEGDRVEILAPMQGG